MRSRRRGRAQHVGLRWLLSFAILFGATPPAEAQPRPPAFQFPAPAGWVRSDEGQIVAFRPPAEPQNVVLFVMPPLARQADFAAQFAALRAGVGAASGLTAMRNVEEQHTGGGGKEQRSHFATYSTRDGDLHVSVRARAEGSSVGAVVFLAASAEAYRRLQHEAAKVLDGMRLPGAAAPAATAPAPAPAPATRAAGFRGPGISGVWMASVIQWGLAGGMNTIQLRWKTFFDDGTMFADLPNAGLLGFDRAASQADPDRPLSWHTYSFSGSSGESRRPGSSARWVLRLEKPNQLKIDSDTFYRCVSVDGLRLEGAWTSYKSPDDPGLDRLPVGQRPIIRFGKDGRFVDEGLFAVFLTSGGDDRPGSGRYELRDFTVILRYDDGRVRHEGFTGFMGADPARMDDRIFIRRAPLQKRPRP